MWNCADDDLEEQANDEIERLEGLRSDDFDVTVAGRSVGWHGLSHIAIAVQPTIFHFIGHGDNKGNISAREEGDDFIYRSGAEVIRTVRKASSGLEGVFLSACYSAKTGPDLLRPLPTVGGWAIGTSSGIRGDEAADFSKTFYEHLVKALVSPKKAFEIAAAYADADYPEPLHRAWFSRSSLPLLSEMARDIYTALQDIFDRDSFRVSLRNEVSMQELDVALQDIALALKTGQVMSRQDRVPIPNISFPAEWLSSDPKILNFVKIAKRGITDTRRELQTVMKGSPDDRIFGDVSNLNPTTPAHEWKRTMNEVDRARNRILKAASNLIAHANLDRFPSIPLSFSQAEIAATRP